MEDIREMKDSHKYCWPYEN